MNGEEKTPFRNKALHTEDIEIVSFAAIHVSAMLDCHEQLAYAAFLKLRAIGGRWRRTWPSSWRRYQHYHEDDAAAISDPHLFWDRAAGCRVPRGQSAKKSRAVARKRSPTSWSSGDRRPGWWVSMRRCAGVESPQG